MTQKSPDKARARTLQRRTGWSYSTCLKMVRDLSDEEIERHIQEQAPKGSL